MTKAKARDLGLIDVCAVPPHDYQHQEGYHHHQQQQQQHEATFYTHNTIIQYDNRGLAQRHTKFLILMRCGVEVTPNSRM